MLERYGEGYDPQKGMGDVELWIPQKHGLARKCDMRERTKQQVPHPLKKRGFGMTGRLIVMMTVVGLVEKGKRRREMSGVRVLVGTRKGAFILTSDGKREKWDVSGPHFAGWEIYHLKGSPADPNRLYASQTQRLVRAGDPAIERWRQDVGAGRATSSCTTASPGTHQWYDGTPHPWEFKRVWHLEPSLTDPDTVYAGVEDAAIFRSTDGGQNWEELSGLRGHGRGRNGSRAPAGCACTRSSWIPSNPDRMYIAISAAGAFRTDDGGKTWKPINRA